ncbi:hypothetical protein AAHA92_16645 [Salvia divinorum]|uniref:CCHC-type domain-containing protein n=1 Tax=Salvia divinorum TaxID=28513 RepID=A0ABD1GZL7_SALDI
MTCQNCHQQGHNSRGCKNDPIEKTPMEKGKRGRPAKKILPENSLADSSRGTLKEHPQGSISANARRVKERALARKEVGVIGIEESGNIYICLLTTINVVNVRSTQESQNAPTNGNAPTHGNDD